MRFLTILVGLSALPSLAVAQSDVPCRRCEVVLSHEIRLGDDIGPGIIESMAVSVLRDGAGNFITYTSYADRLKVFGPDGAFLREVGREGQGPGEFLGIGRVLPWPGGGFAVLDNENARISFHSSSLAFERSVSTGIPLFIQGVAVGPEALVIAAHSRTPERIGLPLHLVHSDGTVVRSFGSEDEMHRPDVPYAGQRVIAGGSDGTIWSAYRNAYLIERWDTAGAKLAQIEHEPDWFPGVWVSDREGEARHTISSATCRRRRIALGRNSCSYRS